MIPLNDRVMRLQRSGIRVFTNLARQTPGCIPLAIGEPDFDTDQQIKAAAMTALFQNRTHYAPNQGEEALRREISAYETLRGNPCDPEQVLVTAGATGALFIAMMGILNPGDEVIVPMPAFPLYESVIIMAGAKLVPLDTKKDGFQITEEALAQVMTDKTKAILLNSPNNPTGVVLNEASVAAVKKAVLGKPIFVICDNVYQGLGRKKCPDLSLDGALKEQVLLCQSFSKPWAMTGWRVGYLTGPQDVVARLMLINSAAITCVPTFLQDACVTALSVDNGAMVDAYARRRALVCRRLTEMGLTFPEPEGAFYVFPEIGKFGLSDEEFCRRLITEGKVGTVPGSCFGCPGHIRISYCTSDAQLTEAMDRLEAFLKRL